MKKIFKVIRKTEQGNRFVTENIMHVITSHNVEQEVQKLVRSDVVIPNQLCNSETCQGLRHWRLLSNLKNNFSKPVRNDMDNKNKLDCFAFARNDEKTVKNLFPYFPISLSFKKKVDSSPNALALNGYGFALMLKLVRLRMTAFTLAETLITLGIIGIVAALTIPTLFANYQKRMTITRLKASYSKLTQALQAATDDYGPVEQWFLNDNDVSHYETIITAVIHEKIIPYAKVIDDCGLSCPLRKKVKICRLNGVCTWGQSDSGYYTIYLADGSSWEFMIDNNGRTMMNIKVYIDINGNGKPNIFGKDIFVVLLDDGVRLLGSDAKYSRSSLLGNCRECCSKNAGSYAGDRCGGLIQRDGWQIMPDYPWK